MTNSSANTWNMEQHPISLALLLVRKLNSWTHKTDAFSAYRQLTFPDGIIFAIKYVLNIYLVSAVYMLWRWRCHKSWYEKNRVGHIWWHYETRAWNRGDILCVLCAVAIEMLTLCGLFRATDSILRQGIDFETRLTEQQMQSIIHRDNSKMLLFI